MSFVTPGSNGNGSHPTSDPAVALDRERDLQRSTVRAALASDGHGRERWTPALRVGGLMAVLPVGWWIAGMFSEQMTAAVGRLRWGPDPAILQLLLVPLGAVVAGARIRPTTNRSRLAGAAALTSAGLMSAAAVAPAVLVSFCAVGAATAAGVVTVAALPLLWDLYPPTRRRAAVVTAFAIHLTAAPVAIAVFAAAGRLGLTWRVGMLAVAGLVAVISGAGWTLADPGLGTQEHRALASAFAADPEAVAPDRRLSERTTQVLAVPSVRPLVEALILLGMVTVAWSSTLPHFLDGAWHLPRGDRMGWLVAVAVAAVVLSIAVVTALSRVGPPRPAFFAGTARVAGLAVAVGGLVTVLSAAMFELVVGLAIGLVLVALATYLLLDVLPPDSRALGSGIFVAALFGVGAIQGLALLGAIEVRFGPSFALAFLGLPIVAAGGRLAAGARTHQQDVDAQVDAAIDEWTIATHRRQRAFPVLACRHVDFAYGPLQVLFDVNLAVDDGEMVALLGTNGAGKSTLLRVISGLAFPQRGSIRLAGEDITYMGAERRVAAGVAQVPGGRGVYPPLSVVENLRLHGYVYGRDRRRVDCAIDDAFSAFPRLAERRNQSAGTLSGGEQQMLALAKALMLKPRLLLIDELSLGLAPKVVGELLDMTRAINAGGTAIILVEQSVNIALTLVHHAYFMEKGQIRFDGPAAQLLGRDDLLRSVFLGGAADRPPVISHEVTA